MLASPTLIPISGLLLVRVSAPPKQNPQSTANQHKERANKVCFQVIMPMLLLLVLVASGHDEAGDGRIKVSKFLAFSAGLGTRLGVGFQVNVRVGPDLAQFSHVSLVCCNF